MTFNVFARKIHNYLISTAVLVCAASTWYQYAWTFEDTFITFRVIDNFLGGYGLRWNVAERVQVFTHPLWLFLLTPLYAVTHEVIVTTAAVSAACTLLTLILLYMSGIYRSSLSASALIALLFFTQTFPSYSSSGFENPLSHLLICLFFITVLKGTLWRSPLTASLVAALGMVNRLDTASFYAPALLAIGLSGSKHIRKILLGLALEHPWKTLGMDLRKGAEELNRQVGTFITQ